MVEVVEVKDKNGNVYKVTIDEITYGQRCMILRKAMKSRLAGSGMDAEIDIVELERGLLLASIKSIDPNVDNKCMFLDSLPIKEAQKLIDAVNKLNPLSI